MTEMILATKLYIPPLRPDLVSRQRLLQQLDAGLRQGRRLTLLSAPAGYGKTTLISAWLHSQRLRAAWISLDEGDSDLVRFMEYLYAAFRTTHPELDTAALALLQSSRRPAAESVLTPLINELARDPQPCLLILDDYHLVESDVVHQAVTFLLDHLPPQVHLVIASRADPPLPVARLRGRGQVNELRLSDLRFTPAEVEAFLHCVLDTAAAPPIFSPQDAAVLAARTEGWAAGLQMAALSLHGREDVSAFIQAFSGSQRFILDYLLEEVLRRQPAPVQRFLLQTSILERLSDDLCSAVTGQPQPGRLAQLQRENLFIIPLDDQGAWYRYHRLFADLLQQRLVQAEAAAQPELPSLLHQRASLWFEQNGWLPEAIEHALAAADFANAARLLEGAAEAVLMRSEIVTFSHWLAQLPAVHLQQRPMLGIYHAWCLLIQGRPSTEIEDLLDRHLAGQDQQAALRAAPLRSYLLLLRGEVAGCVELARCALAGLPKDEVFFRSLAALSLATAYMADYHDAEGVQQLEETAQMSRQAGNIMVAVTVLTSLAELCRKQGQLPRARQLAGEALELAQDARGGYLPIALRALTILGELEREWNHLEQALQLFERAGAIQNIWPGMHTLAYLPLLARTLQSCGDLAGAQAALDQARRLAATSTAMVLDDTLIEMYQAWLWIDQGELERAERWAAERRIEAGPDASPLPAAEAFNLRRIWKYACLVLARLYLAQGQPQKAIALLERIYPLFEQIGRTGAQIETLALKALALRASGQPGASQAALAAALALAQPGGFIRAFVDEGPAMQSLLAAFHGRLAPGDPLRPYLRSLLAAFDTPSPLPPASSATPAPAALPGSELSERELEVLRLLNSALSASQIAAELFVSVHTVRSHIKSIYMKLDVHTRLEALDRARQMAII